MTWFEWSLYRRDESRKNKVFRKELYSFESDSIVLIPYRSTDFDFMNFAWSSDDILFETIVHRLISLSSKSSLEWNRNVSWFVLFVNLKNLISLIAFISIDFWLIMFVSLSLFFMHLISMHSRKNLNSRFLQFIRELCVCNQSFFKMRT